MAILARAAAIAALLPSALAAVQGFNYGSTFTTGAPRMQSDFEALFKTAQGLSGAPGTFNSARLYTMVQAGTASDPISAIPAAISTKTTLLLGLWGSGGDAVFNNELAALKTAISTYGSSFGSTVVGISVGSEDLYRISPTGIINMSGVGAGPDVIANYIKQVKDALSAASLSIPVGHVDTWTAWVNGSNNAVIAACDWIGVDAYPYFQSTMPNDISQGKSLFDAAIGATAGAVGGKPVWVTETGFPVSGKTTGQAVPSLANAKQYWDQVGCPLFGKTNTWWYTLQDASPDTPDPSFGLVGSTLTTTPLFDLSCKNVDTGSSSSSAPASSAPSSGSNGVVKATSSSAAGSSSGASSSVSVPTSAIQVGGSPGGVPTSQLSVESASPAPTGSSSANSGSGSGSGSSPATTSTRSSPSSSSSSTAATVQPNSASTLGGSALAGLLALAVALFVL